MLTRGDGDEPLASLIEGHTQKGRAADLGIVQEEDVLEFGLGEGEEGGSEELRNHRARELDVAGSGEEGDPANAVPLQE